MARIYLVRHCESEGNVCRRAQAQSPALVTRKGCVQSELLRRRFEAIPIDAIYSSDSYRAALTAEPIARERRLPVRSRILLREISTGVWEDRAWGNIAREYPEDYQNWIETPWMVTTPGAGSFQQVADAMTFSLRRFAREVGDGTALVISHSCSIKAALCAIFEKPMTEVLAYGHGENTSVSLLDIDAVGRIRPAFINDASHLTPELRRGWNGVAGNDINMVLESCRLPEHTEALLTIAEAEWRERRGPDEAMDRSAYLEEARSALEKDPQSIVFCYRRGTLSGFARMGADTNLPEDCRLLRRVYVIPELRGKGYGEQLLGHVVHRLRYEGVSRLVMPMHGTPEEARLLEQFMFQTMNALPEYAMLELFPPPCPCTILA